MSRRRFLELEIHTAHHLGMRSELQGRLTALRALQEAERLAGQGGRTTETSQTQTTNSNSTGASGSNNNDVDMGGGWASTTSQWI